MANVVARARYKVEVAWSQQALGMFTFGTSRFGGTDVLAASGWSTTFAGPTDNITNPGDGTRVDAFSIQRGRDNDLAFTQAGTVSVTIRDMVQKYNRRNVASVLYGLLDGGQPIRVSASLDNGVTWVPIYYGFLDTVEWTLVGNRGGSAQLHAVDFMSKLAPPSTDNVSNPIISATGPTTTGAAIGAILDYYRWTDPAMRSLAVGDSIPNFVAGGTAQALQLIQDLLTAERGFFFVAGSGRVTYQSRLQRYSAASLSTLTSVMDALSSGADASTVVNRWIVQRMDFLGNAIGVPQQADDTASQTHNNILDQTLQTPYLNTDSQALNLAQWLVLRTKTPATPVWDVPLLNKDAATLTAMITRELGDRVTLSEPVTPATADFFIEQIRHDVSNGGLTHRTDWKLSATPTWTPFRFGVSHLGGTDVLVY